MPAPICAVCGLQQATYVCQSCGRAACKNCFDASSWTCYGCTGRTAGRPSEVQYTQPFQFGLASLLLLLAFAAIFIGTLLIVFGSMPSSGAPSGAAVILIGPIPIVLGAGPYSFQLVELAVVLTVVAIVVFLFVRRHV